MLSPTLLANCNKAAGQCGHKEAVVESNVLDKLDVGEW